MIKQGTKYFSKTLTNISSQQENGTVHSYDYFENESGKWIYNISFHYMHGFVHSQVEFDKRISIKKAIEEARLNLCKLF